MINRGLGLPPLPNLGCEVGVNLVQVTNEAVRGTGRSRGETQLLEFA
jgi:hypothetical protein